MADDSGSVGVKLVVDDTNFAAGMKRAQAALDDLPKAVQKNTREFENFGHFAKEAGNELGIGIGGGALRAGRALGESLGALRSYIAGAKVATESTNTFTKAQLSLAIANKASAETLAFFGGGLGLGVIAAIGISKAIDGWTEAHQRNIDILEKNIEVADKLLAKYKDMRADREGANVNAFNAQQRLEILRYSGREAMERELAKERAQQEAMKQPSWAAAESMYNTLMKQYDTEQKITKELERQAKARQEAIDTAKQQEEASIRLWNIQNQVKIDAFNELKARQEMLRIVAEINNAWNTRGAFTPTQSPPQGIYETDDHDMMAPGQRTAFEAAKRKIDREAAEFARLSAIGADSIVMGLQTLAAGIQGGVKGFGDAMIDAGRQIAYAVNPVIGSIVDIGIALFSALDSSTGGPNPALRKFTEEILSFQKAIDAATEATQRAVEAEHQRKAALIAIAEATGNDWLAEQLRFSERLAQAMKEGPLSVLAVLIDMANKWKAKIDADNAVTPVYPDRTTWDPFGFPGFDPTQTGRFPTEPTGRGRNKGRGMFDDGKIIPGEDVIGPPVLTGGGGSSSDISHRLAIVSAEQEDRTIGLLAAINARLATIDRRIARVESAGGIMGVVNRGVSDADTRAGLYDGGAVV